MLWKINTSWKIFFDVDKELYRNSCHFFIVNGEKNYFLYYCNKFSHKRTRSIFNNICGWIKMKERLFLNNTASMLTQRWVLKVCLTVVDIEFKNEIHSSVNLSLPNMYCFLIENTSCCFLLSHFFLSRSLSLSLHTH